MIRWPWTRKNPARELALKGAAMRKAEWERLRNATTARLCAETGQPVPEVFR